MLKCLFGRLVVCQPRWICSAVNAGDANPFEHEEIKSWAANLDPDRRESLRNVQKEYQFFQYMDSTMPTRVTVQQAERLLLLDSRNQRLRYFNFLGKNERLTVADKARRLEKAVEGEKRRKQYLAQRQSNPHLIYSLGNNSILRRIIDSTMNRIGDCRLAVGSQFAPSIVFDLSPMRELNPTEVDLTWSQLRECYVVNRNHRAPFSLHFANCDPSLPTWVDNERYFKGGIGQYTIDWTDQSLLNIFPPDKLVYLSPDSRRMVDTFRPDKVYIIASMVDRPNRKNWTLGKAKELNIETAQLPLDRYVKWHSGTKSLALNQVLAILLDVADNGGNWRKAILEHVPKRKLVPKASECSKYIRKKNYDRNQYILSMMN